MRLKTLLLLSLVILSSCSFPKSSSYFFTEQTIPTDKALVYFYRPKASFNSAGWADLIVDGEKKFALLNNTYGYVLLDDGEHEIKFEGSTWGTNWYPGPAIATISVQSGREYYIRLVPVDSGSSSSVDELFLHGLIPDVVYLGAKTSYFFESETRINAVKKSYALQEIRQTKLIKQY